MSLALPSKRCPYTRLPRHLGCGPGADARWTGISDACLSHPDLRSTLGGIMGGVGGRPPLVLRGRTQRPRRLKGFKTCTCARRKQWSPFTFCFLFFSSGGQGKGAVEGREWARSMGACGSRQVPGGGRPRGPAPNPAPAETFPAGGRSWGQVTSAPGARGPFPTRPVSGGARGALPPTPAGPRARMSAVL